MNKVCYNDFKEQVQEATRNNYHTFARWLVADRYDILKDEYQSIHTLDKSSVRGLVVSQLRDELDRVLKYRLFELLGDRDATELWDCL